MIKIKQDSSSKKFTIIVSQYECVRKMYKIASRVSRILNKHGETTISFKNDAGVEFLIYTVVSFNKNQFIIEFISYNNNISLDDVLWILVDTLNFGVGCWCGMFIHIQTYVDNVLVKTNKSGSSIELYHKNAYKIEQQDEEFYFTFAGGLQYFNVIDDYLRIDFWSNHKVALELIPELISLLDSFD